MSVPRSVAEVLADHVTLEVEGIDRMYLNVYVPGLQREQGVACFFRFHRGNQFVSSALMDPISKTFVAALEAFARQEKIPVIAFRKGQRKDNVAAEQRKKFQKTEGVVFIGKAQEKTPVFRTERRRNEKTGGTYPWLVRSTAMVNHFLHLLRGPRLWTVLSEVQHVLPLQRQAVPQRTRICQTATGAEGYRI
jgi:hypothetical protein